MIASAPMGAQVPNWPVVTGVLWNCTVGPLPPLSRIAYWLPICTRVVEPRASMVTVGAPMVPSLFRS